MSTRGRESLCKHFADGELPTQEHFRALIDAMLHMEDEGFRKTLLHGLEISSRVKSDALLTFFREDLGAQPQWSTRFGSGGQQLGLFPGEDIKAPLLTLDARRRVGIDTAEPQHTLHVQGVLGARARVGARELPKPSQAGIKADGGWWDLTEPLRGISAFEVVASASSRRDDRHAIVHAVALNAYNPRLRWLDHLFGRKKRIKSQHAWYSRRCDRLELRWFDSTEEPGKYVLRIRSMCDYEDGDARIEAHVTDLWPQRPAEAAPTASKSMPMTTADAAVARMSALEDD